MSGFADFQGRASGVFLRHLARYGRPVNVRVSSGTSREVIAAVARLEGRALAFGDNGSERVSSIQVLVSADEAATSGGTAIGGIETPSVETEIQYEGRWYVVESWNPYEIAMGFWSLRCVDENPASVGVEGVVKR